MVHCLVLLSLLSCLLLSLFVGFLFVFVFILILLVLLHENMKAATFPQDAFEDFWHLAKFFDDKRHDRKLLRINKGQSEVSGFDHFYVRHTGNSCCTKTFGELENRRRGNPQSFSST